MTDEERFVEDIEVSFDESFGDTGDIPIRLIAPGWGSSGYYPKQILERDMGIFDGAHMYWDHPTAQENKERPERSLSDLAAVVRGPVVYQENGAAGPGSYATAHVFAPYRESVKEMAPYIGVSIRASGTVSEGEAEGRKGRIVEGITGARSVDFVTKPGAGGRILELFESARGLNKEVSHEEDDMATLEEALARASAAEQSLQEAEAKIQEAEAEAKARDERIAALEEANARHTEAVMLSEARGIAQNKIDEIRLPGGHKLPDVTITRLVESLGSNPPSTEDGALDKEAFDKRIVEGIKAEVEYLTKVTGGGSIRGMNSAGGEVSESDKEELDKRLDRAFAGMGLNESTRKHAVGGRS